MSNNTKKSFRDYQVTSKEFLEGFRKEQAAIVAREKSDPQFKEDMDEIRVAEDAFYRNATR